MKRIETRLNVGPDGTVIFQAPPGMTPGEHDAIIIFDKKLNTPIDIESELPARDLGPWPEGFTVHREEIYGDFGR